MPLAQVARRAFVMPPQFIGGPPQLTPEELQPGMDQGPSLVPPGGPPPLTAEQQQDSVAAVTSPMGGMTPRDRVNLAMAGPPQDQYQPEAAALETPTPPSLLKGPAKQESGLIKALRVLLPVARDLVAGTAAGARSPTTIGGVGEGLETQMQLERHRMGLAAAQQKQALEFEKLKLEQQKTASESEFHSAQAGKLRGETAQQPSRLALDQERYRAQAEASRAAAEHNRAQALHERAIAQQFPEKSAAEIKELAARAALHDIEAQKVREYINAGVDSATARLRAKQEAAAGAQAAYTEARAKAYPDVVAAQTTRSNAYAQSVQNTLAIANRKAQTGSLKMADIANVQKAYQKTVNEIQANMFIEDEDKPAAIAAAQEQFKDYLPGGIYYKMLKEQITNPPKPGGPPPLNPSTPAGENPYR